MARVLFMLEDNPDTGLIDIKVRFRPMSDKVETPAQELAINVVEFMKGGAGIGKKVFEGKPAKDRKKA